MVSGYYDNFTWDLCVRDYNYLNYYQFELRKATILKIRRKNDEKIALRVTRL